MNLELNIEKATSEADIAIALRHAAEQVEGGYLEGNLRNQDIEFGWWKLNRGD